MEENLEQSIKTPLWKTPVGGGVVVVIVVLAWLIVVKTQQKEINETALPDGRIILTEEQRTRKTEALKNISTKRINLTEEERQRKIKTLEALN